MTEYTVHKAAQRVVGRCKTTWDVNTSSFSSFRTNGTRQVGTDGSSRYRAVVFLHGEKWAHSAKQSGTAEYAFVSFMQSKNLCCCVKGTFCFPSLSPSERNVL